MPLIEPAPSKRVMQALFQGIAHRIYPQLLHTLGLKPIAAGKGLSAAKRQLWRFMATIAGHDISCDVVESAKGASMTATSQGPHVHRARAAIRKSATLPQVKTQRFELRLLVIPALSVEAVWLNTRMPGGDLLIPFLTGGSTLKRLQVCTEAEFLKALKPLAQQTLAFDDAPLATHRKI